MKLNDDFAIVFASKHNEINRVVARDVSNHPRGESSRYEASGPMPKITEVERIETKRYLVSTENVLSKTKKTFAEKIGKLKERAQVVQRDQEKLRKNLAKYNNFVKEKQQKVYEGQRVYEEEKNFQKTIFQLMSDKQKQQDYLKQAQELVFDAVKKRMVFKYYLQTVVQEEASARNRYKDIGELMKRCETLVMTRDDARMTLKRLNEEIFDQDKILTEFKEAQNERILTLNSQLNGLQDALYQIQASRDSKQRIIDQEVEEERGKALKMANIRLTCLTLWQYVNSRKIILPSDVSANEKEPAPPNIEQQLEAVQAHIEDLEAVIARVGRAENAAHYMSPLPSHSELRTDY